MSEKNSSKQITVAVIGAGSRGAGFGRHVAALPHLGKIVAVAEPRQDYRKSFAQTHRLPSKAVFKTWQEFLKKPKFCDAVVVATMDREHVEPAVAALNKGYHLFLEKPMSVSLEDCRRIEAAQRKAGTRAAVCHSMRYHKGFNKIKTLVAGGSIGKLVSVDQIEQIAFWHFGHSFVRGNWGVEGKASFSLLAKSCHDLDYITFVTGKKALRVSSFGSLSYFKPENAPEGATLRCTDGCPVEPSCPYSALKTYVNANRQEWPADVVSHDHSAEAHLKAIQTGPYGRCVWACDNDVVDHQVVALEYEDGVTATFTMSAFTYDIGRRVTLHGTEGEIYYDEAHNLMTLKRFAENNVEKIELGAERGGHGGGDARALRGWLQAIRDGRDDLILTNVQESLKTHTIVFAAEKSRKEKRMIELKEM
jgi:predicted dehydrogenase